MVNYLFKLVAAFIRSRVLHKNTVWPQLVRNEGKALARLGEDLSKVFGGGDYNA